MKEALLYLMIVVNALIVSVFVIGTYNLPLFCLQSVIVITCIVLAYKCIRHKSGPVEKDLLLIASVLFSPLLLVLICLVLGFLISGDSRLQYLIIMPVWSAYYWI